MSELFDWEVTLTVGCGFILVEWDKLREGKCKCVAYSISKLNDLTITKSLIIRCDGQSVVVAPVIVGPISTVCSSKAISSKLNAWGTTSLLD